MSERIYARLLRLYPPRFREAYGDAALQLFRDRLRDERGFVARLRLWLDIFADLLYSLPGQHRSPGPGLAPAIAQHSLDGVPCFHFLGGERPHLVALMFGVLFSLAAFFTGSIAAGRGEISRTFAALTGGRQGTMAAGWTAFKDAAISPGGGKLQQQAAPGTLLPYMLRTQAGGDRPGRDQWTLSFVLAAFGLPQPPSPPAATSSDSPHVDAALRERLIEAAIRNLKKYYVDAAAAQKIADMLLAHQRRGDYDAIVDGRELAALLTKQMRDVSYDLHLELVYTPRRLAEGPAVPSPDARAAYRKALERENCTFEKTEVLPKNIGYVKLNSFPDPAFCRATAASAMAAVNHADAVIFDLRDNRGGYQEMVMLIASYLFDHPEYMFSPREDTTERSWTQPVPGSRLASKPVYVLTSKTTISGAEQFSYDLKMLKRATIVGETTAGASHSAVFRGIDPHFGMAIPEARPVNPFSKTDWEGTGVEPDVKVNAGDALAKAVSLAQRRAGKTD